MLFNSFPICSRFLAVRRDHLEASNVMPLLLGVVSNTINEVIAFIAMDTYYSITNSLITHMQYAQSNMKEDDDRHLEMRFHRTTEGNTSSS